MSYPVLFRNYLRFCRYRKDCEQSGKLDLRRCRFLYPTTLLPLASFLKEDERKIKYKPPENENVRSYIATILENSRVGKDKSFLPVVNLPKDQAQALEILDRIYHLHSEGVKYGGENAFKYVLGELVDNIYDHSEFSIASVMAQRYRKKDYLELAIFDNGITIPGSFRKKGIEIDDIEGLRKALKGISTKEDKERGFGLWTSMKIFTEALKGKILIVSGRAALHRSDKDVYFKLSDENRLSGTLISVRIPLPTKKVNIYRYIE